MSRRSSKKRLRELAISNVEEMGWRGIKNGALLDLMAGQFQVLVTTDKNLPTQQNLKKLQISAVILPTNDIPSVIELLPQLEQTLVTMNAGDFLELKLPGE